MPRPKLERPNYNLVNRTGTFYVEWREGNMSRRVSCRTKDEKEARRFREEFIAEMLTPLVPDAPTVGAVLDGYLAARTDRHSDAHVYAAKALKRHLEHVPTTSLTSARVADYVAARRKEGAGGAPAKYRDSPRALSDGTLRRELGVLRTALGWAKAQKWIADVPTVDLPPVAQARERWATKDEAVKLLAAADSLHVRTFIALALFTAGRMRAILDLTWDRVDEVNGLIYLGDGKVRGKKRRQTVPIADDLKPYLAEARKAATTDYVVEYRGGRIDNIKRGVAAAVAEAGLKGITPHVFRHTAATWMVQGGVPLKMVADYLGDTEQMIERHYAKHSPSWMREGTKALSLPKQAPVSTST